MEDNTFLQIKKSFWRDETIRKLPGTYLHFLIDVLYLSYEFHHTPFFQTSNEIYTEFNTYRVDFNRKIKKLEGLAISITYKNGKYYFDLTDFFKEFNPLSNTSVTVNNKSESNRCVQKAQVE
jgi:hypothetical protein